MSPKPFITNELHPDQVSHREYKEALSPPVNTVSNSPLSPKAVGCEGQATGGINDLRGDMFQQWG